MLEQSRNNDSRFDKLQGVLLGQDVLEMMAGDSEIVHSLKGIFKNLPQTSYKIYTNICELVINMNMIKYPMGKAWHRMCQYSNIPLGRQRE